MFALHIELASATHQHESAGALQVSHPPHRIILFRIVIIIHIWLC